MTTRPALAAAALLAAAPLAACHPKPIGHVSGEAGVHVSTVAPTKTAITVADRLTCPQTVDAWTRVSAAADGRSCRYTGTRGEVDLAWLSGAPGDPSALLAPERARLDAMMPAARTAAIQVVDERTPDGRKVEKVDMPFLHVSTDGGHKSVSVMGFHVSEHDRDGGDPDDDKAMPTVTGAGAKLVYVLAGARPAPGGWHAVGYDARVDAQGRAVVATFRYAKGDHADDDAEDGLDALLAPSITTAGAPAVAANTADADKDQ